LHLIGFEEPFGFSVVEAMACGTPVVAFRRGSMPELIDHGTTGLLVDDMEQAVAAVALAAELDRPQIRERALSRFGRDRMVDDYLAAYTLFLNGGEGRNGK
jgi:glycosyltransferase involved in cell wall biosynthesis